VHCDTREVRRDELRTIRGGDSPDNDT
jgi:hypothetical protein